METSYLKLWNWIRSSPVPQRAACARKRAKCCFATQPQCDPDEVRYALEQTDAINTLLIKTAPRALAAWRMSVSWRPAP